MLPLPLPLLLLALALVLPLLLPIVLKDLALSALSDYAPSTGPRGAPLFFFCWSWFSPRLGWAPLSQRVAL